MEASFKLSIPFPQAKNDALNQMLKDLSNELDALRAAQAQAQDAGSDDVTLAEAALSRLLAETQLANIGERERCIHSDALANYLLAS